MEKKSVANKNITNSSKPKPLNQKEVQLALIDNFVNLQRVLTNMTIKFDSLSDQISRLLQLFEIAAKSFIKKQEEFTIGGTDDKDLLKKLDTLLDQQKTVAKGITLIEEKIRHKIYGEAKTPAFEHEAAKPITPKPLPRL